MKTLVGDLWLDHLEPRIRKYPHPAVLYIAGFHEGSWIFKNWLQASYAAGVDSWALNFRGHNGSRPVEDIGKVSVQDYIQDVLEVIAHLQNRVILVGHSLGGLVSLRAAQNNQKVAGLVPVSSVPPQGIFPSTSIPSLKRYLKNPAYLKPFLFKKALPPHHGDIYNLVLNGLPERMRVEVFQKLVPDSGLVTRQLALGAIRVNPRQITCPILVVGAADDRLMDTGIQQKIAKKFGGQYKPFPGAHMLPLEDGWEAPIEYILNWAAEHVS